MRRLLSYWHYALLALAVVVVIAGAQAMLFYRSFTPGIEQANRLLFELVVESSQVELFKRIEARLGVMASAGGGRSARFGQAWESFHDQFTTAPVKAIRTLEDALDVLDPAAAPDSSVALLRDDLERLESIYTDRYEPLLDRLENPPLWLWPTTHFIVRYAGVREPLVVNRALHLAQVGEIGTARVLLTGLRASTEDARMLGAIYYLLGRLEFELFRSRPEADLYVQSVNYVTQSLKADPESELARRFLDYLLSLSRAEAAARPGEGEPTRRSDGQGAATSADKRRF